MTVSHDVRPLATSVRCVLSKLLNHVRLLGRPDNRARVRKARHVLASVSSYRGESAADRAFACLRQLDRRTLEEVVLSALEDAGHIAVRCRAYSDSGCASGYVLSQNMPFARIALQIEPYGSPIHPERVGDFNRHIVAEGLAGGLLVHCGRPGVLAKLATSGTAITLLSGASFLNLVLRTRLPPQPLRSSDAITFLESGRPRSPGQRSAIRQPT